MPDTIGHLLPVLWLLLAILGLMAALRITIAVGWEIPKLLRQILQELKIRNLPEAQRRQR